eukprot:gene24262-31215_t
MRPPPRPPSQPLSLTPQRQAHLGVGQAPRGVGRWVEQWRPLGIPTPMMGERPTSQQQPAEELYLPAEEGAI